MRCRSPVCDQPEHGHLGLDPVAASLPRVRSCATSDTLLLIVPDLLGVEYNAHVIESVLKYVAPELGWR